MPKPHPTIPSRPLQSPATHLRINEQRVLQVMDPGLIGGLLLPVLGALPDSAMIIMSGMGGTVAEAQEQVRQNRYPEN
jgi:hypothetical protein